MAASWVVAAHFVPQILALFPSSEWARPLLESGYIGVDLFFVLSGFILAYNYLPRFEAREPSTKQYARFMWLRFARVWPVHFVMLNVFVLTFYVQARLTGGTDTALRTGVGPYLENVFLVHAWWGQGLSYNGPSWSVSAEWFAYLLFPVLAWKALPLIRSVGAALVVIAGCYAVLIAVWLGFFWDSAGAVTAALLRIEASFVAGCCLFIIWRALDRSLPARPLMLAVGVAGVLVGAHLTHGEGHNGVVLAPFCALIVLSLASGEGVVARVLAWRPLEYGGEISYSMYMTHALIGAVGNLALDRLPLSVDSSVVVRFGFLTGLFAAAVVAAVVMYHLVEEPARKALRRMW